MPKALIIIQNTESSLLYAAQAATVLVPRELIPDWMMTLDRPYITDCIPAGSPMRMMRFSIRLSRQSSFNTRRCMSFVRIRQATTRNALNSWERIVARAAPTTPRRQNTTSTISSAMFTRQLAARKYNGRLESPTARRIAAPTL